MRINEITNSTEKLELLRMIDAAIWQSFDAESAYGDYDDTEAEQGVAATPANSNQFAPKPAGIRTTQQPTQKPVKKVTDLFFLPLHGFFLIFKKNSSMKNILTFIFLGLAFTVNSQTKLTSASMYDSLNARVYRIECALYDGVVSGKIKPYKDDSLTSVYSLQMIKDLSTVYRSVQNSWNATNEPDSIYETSLNPHVQGYGLLTVLKPTKIDLNSIEDNYTFSSVAVLYQPTVGRTNIKLPIQPWFYIRYAELSKVLTSYQITLLTQLTKMLSSDKYLCWGTTSPLLISLLTNVETA